MNFPSFLAHHDFKFKNIFFNQNLTGGEIDDDVSSVHSVLTEEERFRFNKSHWWRILNCLDFSINSFKSIITPTSLNFFLESRWDHLLKTDHSYFVEYWNFKSIKDYYWEKLYPGLADYESNIAPLTAGDMGDMNKGLNSEVVESNLSGMLDELKTMSASLSSLKALQEMWFGLKKLDYLHGWKSAILAIFQKGLGWPCPRAPC